LPEDERAHRAELLLDTDLATALDMLVTLPERLAMPVAVRAAALAEGALAGTALEVVAHFGWGELAEDVLAKIDTLDGPATFPGVIRALRKLGARSEMAELCAQNEHVESFAPLVAGAWAFLGDVRSNGAFDAACARTFDSRNDRLGWFRTIARGYALATVHDAMDGARRLAKFACTVTDSLGTASHYHWTVLHVVASCGLIFDEVCDD
jgi:hypothetical protein